MAECQITTQQRTVTVTKDFQVCNITFSKEEVLDLLRERALELFNQDHPSINVESCKVEPNISWRFEEFEGFEVELVLPEAT